MRKICATKIDKEAMPPWTIWTPPFAYSLKSILLTMNTLHSNYASIICCCGCIHRFCHCSILATCFHSRHFHFHLKHLQPRSIQLTSSVSHRTSNCFLAFVIFIFREVSFVIVLFFSKTAFTTTPNRNMQKTIKSKQIHRDSPFLNCHLQVLLKWVCAQHVIAFSRI